MFYKNKFRNILLLPALLLTFSSCDTSIEPIIDKGKQYSIYGPLHLKSTPNYIRVHDTRASLNEEATRNLDVEMVFTNLSTGEASLLQDSVVLFDHLYTHNYKINTPIEYDTRYKINIEDGEGFRDSLISVTTKKTEITILQDTVKCEERFRLELSNIDIESGERLDTEVGIYVGNSWQWTSRRQVYAIDDEQKTLALEWSPNGISILVFGEFDWIDCSEFDSDKIQFRFTHIGYVEGQASPGEIPDTTSAPVNQKVVLSTYSGGTELHIDESEFID